MSIHVEATTLDPQRTRASLLMRLRNRADDAAWMEFTALYEPLIYRLARQRGMQDADCREIVQTVLMSVVDAIEKFDAQNPGTFRGWLSKMTRHATIDHFRRLQKIAEPTGDSELRRRVDAASANDDPIRNLDLVANLDPTQDIAAEFDQLHRKQLFLRAATLVRQRVSETNWMAFWKTTVEAQPIHLVAAELQLSPGAVYVARSRMLQRIRLTVSELGNE